MQIELINKTGSGNIDKKTEKQSGKNFAFERKTQL